jgi:hypothetical protein
VEWLNFHYIWGTGWSGQISITFGGLVGGVVMVVSDNVRLCLTLLTLSSTI